jgi:branched-chain amino acid transport system ATP-binding protein
MSELAGTAVQPQPEAMAASPTVLEAHNLVTGYGDLPFLRISQLVLHEGEAVALLGANGSGKTTLLRTIMGLQPTWEGSVIVLGEDITGLATHRRAAKGLIMVPPGKALFAGLDVEDNLLMGAYLEPSRTVVDDRLARVYELFPELHEMRDSLAGVLSGGEQQMCAIGRALMSAPKVLL